LLFPNSIKPGKYIQKHNIPYFLAAHFSAKPAQLIQNHKINGPVINQNKKQNGAPGLMTILIVKNKPRRFIFLRAK
jgi:hypothetical protein